MYAFAPNDSLRVDSLAGYGSGSYTAYVSALSGAADQQYVLQVDAATGQELARSVRPSPCMPTPEPGARIGADRYVQARAIGANRFVLERYTFVPGCNAAAPRLTTTDTLELPGFDTLVVAGAYAGEVPGSFYVVGSAGVQREPFAWINRHVALRFGDSLTTSYTSTFSTAQAFQLFEEFVRVVQSTDDRIYFVGLAKEDTLSLRQYKPNIFEIQLGSQPEINQLAETSSCLVRNAQALGDEFILIEELSGCSPQCSNSSFDLASNTVYRRALATGNCRGYGSNFITAAFAVRGQHQSLTYGARDLLAGPPAPIMQDVFDRAEGDRVLWRATIENTRFRAQQAYVTADNGGLFAAIDGGTLRLRKFDSRGQYGFLRPELFVSQLTSDRARAPQGGEVTLDVTLLNSGDTAVSGETTVHIYIAENSGGFRAVLLDSFVVNNLAAQSAEQAVRTVNIPNGAQPGDYFLIASVDEDNTTFELDEENNRTTVPIEVTAISSTLAPAWANSISLQPNLVNGAAPHFAIQLPSAAPLPQPYQLIAASGQMIQQGVLASRRTQFDLQTSSLPAGVYLVQLPEAGVGLQLVVR